jgi:hypothetical protein
VNPVVLLIAGALFVYLAATGKAEDVWRALTGKKK